MAFVEQTGTGGLARDDLIARAGLSPLVAAAVERELQTAGKVTLVGPLLVATSILEERAAAVMHAVAAYHDAQPLAPGIPREEARERLFGRAAPEVFDHVLAQLERAGRLVARDTLAAAGRTVALSDDEARAREALSRAVQVVGPRSAGSTKCGGGGRDRGRRCRIEF